MGLFDVDKSAVNNDQRVAADTEAIISQGGSGAARDDAQSTGSGAGVISKDDAISLGGYGSKNTLGDDVSGGYGVSNYGGVALSGYANKTNLGGVDIGGANSGVININDAAALESTISDALDAVRDANAENAENIKYLTGEALAKNADLAENKQTDGTLPIAKIVMWIAGLFFGAWALVAIAKSKSNA